MSGEYDTRTRRIKVQILETTYRAIEKQAETDHKTPTGLAGELLEQAAKELAGTLTLEDELIVNDRIRKNIETRMKKREKK